MWEVRSEREVPLLLREGLRIRIYWRSPRHNIYGEPERARAHPRVVIIPDNYNNYLPFALRRLIPSVRVCVFKCISTCVCVCVWAKVCVRGKCRVYIAESLSLIIHHYRASLYPFARSLARFNVFRTCMRNVYLETFQYYHSLILINITSIVINIMQHLYSLPLPSKNLIPAWHLVVAPFFRIQNNILSIFTGICFFN